MIVQGPVKNQQPNGMSHGGGGGIPRQNEVRQNKEVDRQDERDG